MEELFNEKVTEYSRMYGEDEEDVTVKYFDTIVESIFEEYYPTLTNDLYNSYYDLFYERVFS